MNPGALNGLNLLVLDDEPLLRRQLTAALERQGADVTTADCLRSARQLAREASFDFALLDVNLPDGRGIELLKEKAFGPGTGIVVMTAEGGIAGAVEALKLGAIDYLAKPFEPEALMLTLARARRSRQTARAVEHQRSSAPEQELFLGGALASLSSILQRILAADQRLGDAGQSLPPVLIQGETGVGKTSLARWLRSKGPRAEGPMIEANCAAIPEQLAESELFGHEKGAFTDARATRIGLFEAANGGTLFLDELASLSPGLQAKLLTVLEDRKIRRVGGQREIPVDVRVIAAANQDLREAVKAGKFREDLYHRLDLFRLSIPPLRERTGDIAPLAELLVARLSRRHHVAVRPISSTGRRRLEAYGWPGNVRELSHEIERALVFEDSAELHFDQLMGASHLPPAGGNAALAAGDDWFNEAFQFPDSGFSLEDAILRLIRHALSQTSDNVSAAARRLGVSRDFLRYRLGGWKDGTKGT
jgi:two-component system, NtrC family, response regulator AtoC